MTLTETAVERGRSMNGSVSVVSLGCAKNLVDSEVMMGLLKEKGFVPVEDAEDAEVIVINTCAFIEDAKEESVDTILEAARLKEKGRCRVLVVTGCLSQRYGKKLMNQIPEIDAMLGTSSYPQIIQAIQSVLKGYKAFNLKKASYALPENLPRVQTTPAYMAYLKIADGCDNRCSYCIIPALRGKYRSRKKEEILKEAVRLAGNGVKELILVAQDTTRYGMDLYGEPRLGELLEELCTIDRLKWIRLLYCYPDGIDSRLVEVIRKNKKICNYLDVPIQHINDHILRQMNRNTTGEKIEQLIIRLKKDIPGLILRTSLIVGFPGESQKEFKDLLTFVNKGYFDRLGVFPYSREEGTPAFHLTNRVSKDTALKRQRSIMEVQQSISLKKNLDKIDNIYEVLVEGREDGMYFGRTYGDAPEIDNLVYFSSATHWEPGTFARVKVGQAYEYDLIGECINESGE